MDHTCILLCEPQCHGYEHAQFNAALLLTILNAFPQSSLIFLGESEHLRWVREALTVSGKTLHEKVEWRASDIPPRHRSGWLRLTNEKKLIENTYDLARQRNAQAVIFASITTAGLLMLKRYLSAAPQSMPSWMVFHSVLKQARGGLPIHRLRREIPLRPLLRTDWPKNLSGIVLGPSILEELVKSLPAANGKFYAMDIPYVWPNAIAASQSDEVICLGYFGVRMIGLKQFYQLAAKVQAKELPARFMHVGFLHDPKCLPASGIEIDGLTTTPLGAEEFSRRAQSVTYGVWLSSYGDFRLLASATFLDALAYAKPGIYMRTPYIEHYFERLGNIGYLCDSLNEVEDTVFEILRNFPAERYNAQRENIIKGREIFLPQNLAPQLRHIIGMRRPEK